MTRWTEWASGGRQHLRKHLEEVMELLAGICGRAFREEQALMAMPSGRTSVAGAVL